MTREEVWVQLYVNAVDIGMSSRSLTPKDAGELADKRLEEWEKRFGPLKPSAQKDSITKTLEASGIPVPLSVAGQSL